MKCSKNQKFEQNRTEPNRTESIPKIRRYNETIMVWNAQDAEEKQESEKFSWRCCCKNFGTTLCNILFLVPIIIVSMYVVCILFILVLFGPTLVIDFLFFWKRQALRKQLISTSVPVELHIVHRRQLNGYFFFRLGYQMDNNVSYVAKNEEKVTEQIYKLTQTKSTKEIRIVWRAGRQDRSLIWHNGILLGNVSSSYPSSGPCHPESFSAVCGLCLFGLIFTAFETFYWSFMLTFAMAPELYPEPRTICYLAVAGVLFLIGFLISACKFARWRNTTLHGYEVVDELPSTMIDDDNDDDKNNDGLEMGMLAVQEDDDTETLALNKEYLRTMIN